MNAAITDLATKTARRLRRSLSTNLSSEEKPNVALHFLASGAALASGRAYFSIRLSAASSRRRTAFLRVVFTGRKAVLVPTEPKPLFGPFL